MRFGSDCSGIEAASVAFGPLGWSAAWFAEIEQFPAAVLAHRYPHVPNLGDMTTIAGRVRSGEVEAPDVLCGGTPCFTAGHLVLTASGYLPIESVKPGDMVMTHLGRLRRIVRVGSKSAAVGTLRAVGLREPLTVTADHPFLAVDWRNQSTKRGGQYARIEHCGEPLWVEAKDMPGRQWCALTAYDRTDACARSKKFAARDAMYVAGMYLGDGHIRRWGETGKKALILSLNDAKLAKLSAVIGDDAYSVTRERTSVRATICDTALCEWLEEQFGKLSHLKRIPAWVLGHEHRAMLLQGYLDTDGSKLRSGVSITTTSRAMAYGVADILNAEGRSASVGLVETPDTCVIEGRTVNQRDWYQVRAFDLAASRKSRVRHGYLLRTVQSFDAAGIDTVFNIEVDGDNSYVVNGSVVHNCQAFSIAGLRNSLADERGNLTLKFVEQADAIDDVRRARGEEPAIVFWENVPGVLSTADNAFGCFLGALAGEDCALEPAGGRWTDAGCVFGPVRAIAWRTLDAQYFGLAQRRRRVFVVASARDGFDPAKILFEFDGVRRDSPPRREARKEVAGDAGGSAACADIAATLDASFGRLQGCSGQDINHGHSHLVAQCVTGDVTHTPRGEGFDASEDGTGLGTPIAFSCKDYGGDAGEISPTLRSMGHSGSHANAGGQVAVAFSHQAGGTQTTLGYDERSGTSPTISAHQTPAVHQSSTVRRLTARECERLQGFPDDWTKIPYRNKPADQCPDGPRYKALGNSWAVPVVAWIGRRIEAAING